MRFVLKTEVNAKGNKVFSKVRMGKEFIYLAKAEDGSIGEVDKDWVLSNQKNIVNLGVSGDNIYPVTELDKRKRFPDALCLPADSDDGTDPGRRTLGDSRSAGFRGNTGGICAGSKTLPKWLHDSDGRRGRRGEPDASGSKSTGEKDQGSGWHTEKAESSV